MPRLHAKHRTEIRYAGAVGESVNEIRLVPLRNGRQQVEWAHVRDRAGAPSWSGTATGTATRCAGSSWSTPHESLVVEAEAVRGHAARPRRRPSAGGGAARRRRRPGVPRRDGRVPGRLAPRAAGREPVGELRATPSTCDGAQEGVLAWARAPGGARSTRPSSTRRGATEVDTPGRGGGRGGPRRLPGHGPPHDRRLPPPRAWPRATSAAGSTSPGREGPGESHAWVEAARAGPGLGGARPHPPRADGRALRAPRGGARLRRRAPAAAAATSGRPPRRWT